MKQPTMNDDIKKYPKYMVTYDKCLIPADWITSTSSYNHCYELHHFVRKSVRKNSPEFYERVEHLQKLILMPAQMNKDLETMGEERFFEKYGMNKNDLIFSRLKYREGYYD